MPATSLGEGTPPKTGSSNNGGARPLPNFSDFHLFFTRFHLKQEQLMLNRGQLENRENSYLKISIEDRIIFEDYSYLFVI